MYVITNGKVYIGEDLTNSSTTEMLDKIVGKKRVKYTES